jgi:hypothetical protein
MAHRHYKGLPPSSRCLTVGEYPRVDQVIAEFFRVLDVMRIGYIALSTLYAVPFSAWSRWRGAARTAHVVDAWYLLHLWLLDVSLHDPIHLSSFIIIFLL